MTTPNTRYPTNDPVYLESDSYGEPKESFKQLVGLIKDDFGDRRISLVDVGCASGAFLLYAARSLNLAQLVGVDISPGLLDQARQLVADGEFIEDSLLEFERLAGRQFDACTCVGTVAILDDLDVPLRNLLSVVRPGGVLYIHDLVNDNPIDVLVRYRQAGDSSEWRPGFNVRSVDTYRRLVSRLDPGADVSFLDFEMPFALARGGDPMRAWTIQTEERPHQLVVGTGQLLNFKVVRIARR